MQLEQQESFTISGPQLEVFGQVETKLPAPAKKRSTASFFLVVLALLSVFGIGGAKLKGQYKTVQAAYTQQDRHGNSIQNDLTASADYAASLIRQCETVLPADTLSLTEARQALADWNALTSADPAAQYTANLRLYNAADALHADASRAGGSPAIEDLYDSLVSVQSIIDREGADYNTTAERYNATVSAFPANVIGAVWGAGQAEQFGN